MSLSVNMLKFKHTQSEKKRRAKTVLLLLCVGLFFSIASHASAVAVNVYYSVGQNTTDHSSGGNISITSGVATFTVAQIANNLGVGDRLNAGGNIYYLASKIDTKHWNVVTKLGAIPVDLASTAVTSITHAYASMSAALTGAKDSSHITTANLVTANVILNIPCYYDTGADTTSGLAVSSYTTGSLNYIRIYTPVSTSTEANASQRHTGKWTTNAYRIELTNANGFSGTTNYIRFDGLQIKITSTATYAWGINVSGKLIGDTTDIQISNNIIKSGNGGGTGQMGIENYRATASANVYRIWNNIIYGFNCASGAAMQVTGDIAYVYNNTLYNNYQGIGATWAPSTVTAINNISQDDVSSGFVRNYADSSSNNISDFNDAPGSNSLNSTKIQFIDATNEDFHLAPGAVAINAGANLSGDSNLAFNTDIDADARPFGSGWDIGADESTHTRTDFVAPSVTTFSMPANTNAITVPATLTATDDVGATGYLITESSSIPSLGNPNWSDTAPATFTFGEAGVVNAYAWVRDYEGNISPSASQTITITLTGAVYYVDNCVVTGSDSNNGTDPSTPWLTVAKVNSSAFNPADSILFHRGCTWREQLTVLSSGLANAPITFGAYGTGNKPIISGADTVSGWTNYSGNIYVASTSPANVPNQLYVDGTFYDIAHYPNSGWLTATANSYYTSYNTIIDSNLTLTSDQIIGATVMVRANDWYIGTTVATDYNPATYTITLHDSIYPGTQSSMIAGYGFYLQNMLWMLDSPGEWYYDSTAHQIYLWAPNGDNPSSHSVEISNRSYGINDTGKNYITIQNLEIDNANQQDVYISNASNITINGITASGGQNGILLTTNTNSSITNNSIQNTLSDGIQATTKTSNEVVSKNTINNAGNVGMPKVSDGAIYITGAAMTANNNTVTNSGYIGIDFRGGQINGSQTLVENNIIDRSCLVLDDCGGIYTEPSGNPMFGTISGNTVTNSIGNASGTNHTTTMSLGIYLDDLSYGISILNNIVSNTDVGIFLHSSHDTTVTGNNVYSSRKYAYAINRNSSTAAPGLVRNNIATNNIFETLGTDAVARYYTGQSTGTNLGPDTPPLFGTFNNNTYYHPNSSTVIGNVNVYNTLADWQQSTGQDLNSTDLASAYNPITVNNPNATWAQSKNVIASTTAGTTLSYAINNTGVNTCDASLTFTSYASLNFHTEADVGKTVCYRAQDYTGNVNFYALSNAISGIDATGPLLSNLLPLNNSARTRNPPPVFTWSATDALSGPASYNFYWDSSLLASSITSPYTLSNPTCGYHTWSLRALDNVNNYTDSAPLNLDVTCQTVTSASVFTNLPVITKTITTPAPTITAPTVVTSSPASNSTLPPSPQTPPTTNPEVSTTTTGTSSVLKLGSVGNDVKALQKFLNKHLKPHLTIDGNFGLKTAKAVKKWQKAHGLMVDGVVGPQTRKKME